MSINRLTASYLDNLCLSDWIPHQGKMVLLDKVSVCDEVLLVAQTSSHLRVDNPLSYQGNLPAYCIVEYAAQAMALHASLSRQLSSQTLSAVPALVQQGYLVSVRKVLLNVAVLHTLEQALNIQVEKIVADDTLLRYQFTATTSSENRSKSIIATGQLAVFLKK